MLSSKRALYWSLLLAGAAAAAFAPLPLNLLSTPHTSRVFHLDARQFAYSPSVLQVAPGDSVTMNLTSTDVTHGLYLDGYGVSMQAEPGQTATLTFVANRTGSFRFRCNITCGAMHPFMIGKLIVGTDDGLIRGFALAGMGLLGLAFAPIRTQPPRLDS